MGEDLAVLRWIDKYPAPPIYVDAGCYHPILGSNTLPVADICRKVGITQATYFNWKKKYDGLLPNEMRRLKQLEDENNKLRKGLLSRSGIMVWRANRSVPPRGL
jgi:hypothetical protein